MPCRCRTSRAGGRKAGSRSCCGYVGCYISGCASATPPHRCWQWTFALHAGARGKRSFREKTKTSFFPSGPTHEPCLSPTRVWTASPWLSASATLPPAQPPSRRWRESSSPEAGPVSWNLGRERRVSWLGIYNFYLKRILPVVGRLSGDPGAYAYLARSIIEFPSADALSDEMRAAGFKRIYHIPLCSGIVCLHVAEKG